MAREKKEDNPKLVAYEKLLEVYKLQNPVKYAQKEASGEFERKRVALE